MRTLWLIFFFRNLFLFKFMRFSVFGKRTFATPPPLLKLWRFSFASGRYLLKTFLIRPGPRVIIGLTIKLLLTNFIKIKLVLLIFFLFLRQVKNQQCWYFLNKLLKRAALFITSSFYLSCKQQEYVMTCIETSEIRFFAHEIIHSFNQQSSATFAFT